MLLLSGLLCSAAVAHLCESQQHCSSSRSYLPVWIQACGIRANTSPGISSFLHIYNYSACSILQQHFIRLKLLWSSCNRFLDTFWTKWTNHIADSVQWDAVKVNDGQQEFLMQTWVDIKLRGSSIDHWSSFTVTMQLKVINVFGKEIHVLLESLNQKWNILWTFVKRERERKRLKMLIWGTPCKDDKTEIAQNVPGLDS